MEIRDSASTLQQLIQLQDVNSSLSALRHRIDAVPEERSRLDAHLEEISSSVTSAEKAIEEAKSRRRSAEGEVDSLRSKLSHYKGQLMEVKTNTEYQAMLHEIAFVEQKIQEKEDAILEDMLEMEELEEQLAETRRVFESRKKEIEDEKAELETALNQAKSEVEHLQTEQSRLEGELPPDFLARYKRIAAARNGVAMAAVNGDSCEACHVRLRPQLVAEVKTGRAIILCENCNRILYFPSQAPS